MQKTNTFVISITILFLLIFTSCSSSDDNQVQHITTPEAIAANDSLAKGVYKGIITGSSGYFRLYIKNGDDTVSGKLFFDGQSVDLSCSALSGYTSGVINNAVFSGTIGSDTYSVNVSIDSDGSSFVVNSVTIPGHASASAKGLKETSSQLVELYQGVLTTDGNSAQGVFTMAIKGNSVIGRWVNKHGTNGDEVSSGYLTGTISDSSFTGTDIVSEVSSNVTLSTPLSIGDFTGSKSGNSMSGRWTQYELDGSQQKTSVVDATGTWSVTRAY